MCLEATKPPLIGEQAEAWDAIQRASEKYGINFKLMWELSFCESRHRQSAVGDSGLAVGIFQWHNSSWKAYCSHFGVKLDRYSVYDQAELTALVLSEEGVPNGNWYNCFRQYHVYGTIQ